MNNFDNGYNSTQQQTQGFDSIGNTIYYDSKKIKMPGKIGKIFLILWAIATVALLAFVIIGNKGNNYVAALIWQAVFVVSFYLFMNSQIVLLKPFCIAGMFISFSAAPSSLFNVSAQESAETATGILLPSIIPTALMFLFLAMFSLAFTKQQYDRKSARYCTVDVNATVSKIKRSYTTLGKLNIPVLAYTFNGRKYETVYNRPMDFSKNRYQVGQTAIIKIDPSNPSNIYVAPQSFNQTNVQTPNEDISAIVNEFKSLYENPEQYNNENNQTYAGNNEYNNQYNNQYRNPEIETNTTYHNRKPAKTMKATPMGCIFLLWFVLSIAVGFFGAYINPLITLMAFGQIPLVIGIILFFGIGEGTTHSPTAGGCMFLVGLVLVVISALNLFGGQEIKQFFVTITPLLMLSVFNIAGMALICVPLYNSYMNKKHHTESVTGYVIGINHKVTYKKKRGFVDEYAPLYGYTYKGKKYITESVVYSETDYPSQGSSRNIFINPYNPKEIYEPERSNMNNMFCIMMGVFTVGMSLFATFACVMGIMS